MPIGKDSQPDLDLNSQEWTQVAEEVLRARCRSQAQRAASKVAHDEILYAALVRLDQLFREHATSAQRQRDRRIARGLKQAGDTTRRRLVERWLLLVGEVELQSLDADASMESSQKEAERRKYDQWVRSYKTARSALDRAGLKFASLTVEGSNFFVHMGESNPDDFWRVRPELVADLRARLGTKKLRLYLSTSNEIPLLRDGAPTRSGVFVARIWTA